MYILYDCCEDCIFLSMGSREDIKKKANAYVSNLKHPATRQILKDISNSFRDLPDIDTVADTMVVSLSVIEVTDDEELYRILNTVGYLGTYIEENLPINLIDSLLDRSNLVSLSVSDFFNKGGETDSGQSTF